MAESPAPVEVDLTQFPFVDSAQADGMPVVVATQHEGQTDVALKGSFMIWDKDHVAWWERGLRDTYAAVKDQGSVAAMYFNPKVVPGQYRFYGQVVQVVEPGELRDQVWARVNATEQGRDPERKGVGVIVRIDQVKRGAQPPMVRGATSK